MTRLPEIGGDNNDWGTVLNEYLEVAHTATGTLKSDTVPTEDSTLPVTSNGVFDALALKVNKVNGIAVASELPEFELGTDFDGDGDATPVFIVKDTSPVQSSVKPITSGGVYDMRATLLATITGLENRIQALESASNTTPPAPTNLVVDNVADTATWTLASGFAAAEHEYSTNSGSSWTTASTNSVSVGDVSIGVGVFRVRVKAATGRNPSAMLSNSTAFTLASLDPTIVQVNFSNEFFGGSIAGWNLFKPSAAQAQTPNGYSLSNLLNTSGAATAINLAIGTIPFDGASAASNFTPTGTPVYPSDVFVTAFTVSMNAADDAPTEAMLDVSGLNPTATYTFKIPINGMNGAVGAKFRGRVGAITDTKDAGDYTETGLITLPGITGSATQTIGIRKLGVVDGPFGGEICGLVIEQTA